MNYWWMNTDPESWNIFTRLKVGQSQRWRARGESGRLKKYTKIIGPGDRGLLYQLEPRSELVAEMVATKLLVTMGDDSDHVTFKLERFIKPVGWSKIATSMVFSESQQKTLRRETFYPLTAKQYSLLLSFEVSEKRQSSDQEDDLEKIESLRSIESIRSELLALRPTDPTVVEIRGKTYSRDAKTIAQLKRLREYKCQFCGTSILKRDGSAYVEAAHITGKSVKGPELPSNIIILCPNHHKEFDYGNLTILQRNLNKIRFRLNGIEYQVDLSI